HAGGITVTLTNLASGDVVFAGQMDSGGRLSQEIPPEQIDPKATFELVFATGPYWAGRDVARSGQQIMNEVVLRFSMPDPHGRYHMPLILNPNAYSAWWSA
ncbi:MAG: hydroxyisourate hydrolase, partial [Alphaproteobacteria bacterium]